MQKKNMNAILKSPNLTAIQTIVSKEMIEMVEKRLNNDLGVMLQGRFLE